MKPLSQIFLRISSRSPSLAATLAFLAAIALQSCSTKALEWSGAASVVSGTVLPLSTASAVSHSSGMARAVSASSVCTNSTAKLYQVGSDGRRQEPAIATSPVDAQGNYRFEGVRSLGLKVVNRRLNNSYLVDIESCGSVFTRLLTGTKQQDIGWGSTLVAYSLNTPAATQILAASPQKLDSLYGDLKSFDSFNAAYAALITSTPIRLGYEDTVGTAPEALEDAAPNAVAITVPPTIREGETASISINAKQWDTNYPYAYEWKLDGQLISTAANPSFVPSGNSQGPHNLTVTWGKKDGGGTLDATKPRQVKSFPIVIDNNVLPQPPLLSAVSPNVNTPAVSLNIGTGASLASCDSFSALAITEDIAAAPVAPGAYTYSCSQAPSQTLLYNLQNGIGPHTLYLWAMDAAGVVSLTPRSLPVNYSLIIPSVAITSPGASQAFQGAVTFSGTCEDDSGDVSLTGAVVGSPVHTPCVGGVFSRAVNLSGADGSKNVAASQTNQFGNTGSATITILKDTQAPAVVISSLVPTTTNAASFSVNIAFSEDVTGFDVSKLSVTNGTVASLTGSGASYSFTLTPVAQGTVTVDIAAGAGADPAGNSSLAASTFSRIYDSVPPTVILSSSAPNSTRTAPIPVTVDFSEPVTGLALGSFVITNGTASGLAGSGTSYTINIAPSGQGAVSVALGAGAGQDAGGNGSLASATLSRSFDSIGPSLTLSSSAPNPTNATPISVQAVFGESVTGFTLASVSVTNGTAGNLSGSGSAYVFEVTPSANGNVSVAIATGAGKDAAGNDSVAASISRTFNNSRPSVNLTSVRPSPSNAAPFPVTVTFSAPVTGFDASKVTLSNATLSGFTGSGSTYNFQATPSTNGTVSMSIAANSGVDSASNQSLASNTLAIVYDTVNPVVSITSPGSGAFVNEGNRTAFAISGSCSEEGQPVAVSVGSVNGTGVCAAGAWSASLDLSALADGALSLTSSQTDLAGNIGTSSAVSLTKDTAAPTITLAGVPASPSNVTALAVSGGGAGVSAYRYKVGVASATDCTLATGYSAEVGIGTNFTDSLAAIADGPVRICAVGRDLAGNFQAFSAATIVNWTKDTVVTPFGSLAITPASPGKLATPTISGSTEGAASVRLYAQAACAEPAVAIGTAAAGGAFALASSALGSDGSYALSVKATDAAGNNLCSSSISYLLDTIAPTVTISSTAPVNTNTAPVPVSLVFAEPVTGLSLSGLTVTNGTSSGLSGSGTSYALNVTPAAQGNVTVTVNSGAAVDTAGNMSQASLTLTRNFDTVAPALTIASPVAGTAFNTATITLAGACEAGLSIALSGSGLSSPSSASCPAGNYSVAVTPTAGEGTKNITLSQTDAAGNVATQTRSFEKDTVAPALLFTSAAVQNQNTNGSSVTFTGTCETGVAVVVSGADTNSVSCTGSSWSYVTAPRASDGNRAYTFTQTDAAGNVSSISGSWIRDTVLPVVAISTPAANFVAYESITVTGTCENGLPVVLNGAGLLSTFNNVVCSSGAFSQFVYFSGGDGNKVVTASQTDLAGNVGTNSRTFVRDTTPPILTQTLRSSPFYNNSNTAQFGGACENGISIIVSGAESGTATCSSGAWTYTNVSQNSDANRAYNFKQTDAAGNVAQISATWIRDTVVPVLTLTSSSSFTTSGNTVSFAGTCENGLNIAVSGAQTATVPCSSGTWSFATNQTSDNVYNYTFSESDFAGNVSSLSGSWTRSTSGPTLTITQSTPQVTNGSSLLISGTCSGGTAGSSGTINITGAITATVSCSSTDASAGTWSYTANQTSDGIYNYTFGLTDNFASPRSTSASLSWMRDATAPIITSGSFTINGGMSSTAVSFNPVSFAATDNFSTVKKFCLKYSSSTPTANDPCWVGANTPSNSINISNFSFNIGIIPQAYVLYLWISDGAGNISINSAIVGTDRYDITLAPVAPPNVGTVILGNSDLMNGNASERSIPAGQDVFVRWTAGGSALGATPITLYFTSDDTGYTQIVSGLANGNNGCSSTVGSGSASISATGCYRWSNGSPTNGYYRVRVSATDTFGASTFANSLPANVSAMQILAGNTEAGINGAASSAFFQADYSNGAWIDAQNLAVSSKGILYFRDINYGVLSVDPKDGKLNMVVRSGAATSGVGDGGSISTAQLKFPVSIAIDSSDRLLIFDYDRIRRIDFNTSPPTINTIIGGGASTVDALANAKNLSIANAGSIYTPGFTKWPLTVSPNGDIYFFSDSAYGLSIKRLRKYSASTGAISSIYFNGSVSSLSNATGYSVSDLSKCASGYPLIEFAQSGAVLNSYVAANFHSSFTGCTSPSWPSGGAGSSLVKVNLDTGTTDTSQIPAVYISNGGWLMNPSPVPALDGKIYLADKNAGYIRTFDTTNNQWTTLVGTGTKASCADGTVATSCAIDPGGAFVDSQGRLYFVDRGRIRTIQAGNVITLYGQTFNFGDGGIPTNARFGVATSVAQRSDSKIIVHDTGSYRLRMFERNGVISTIAGNDTFGGTGSTSVPAINLSLPSSNAYPNFFLDGSDNLYYNVTGSAQVRLLPNSYATDPTNTKWTKLLDSSSRPFFEGSTPYYNGNGASAGTLANTGQNDFRFMGFNGSALLTLIDQYSSNYVNGIIGETRLSDGLYSFNYGPFTSAGGSSFCSDGTSLSSCSNGSPAMISNAAAGWDPFNNKWLILSNDNRSLRSFGSSRAGSIGTATTFANPALSFLAKSFSPYSSHLFVYYCNASNGRIYLRDADTAAEVALNWPINSVKCTGTQLVYDQAQNSIIFPMKQNGMYGVGEVLNAHPSANGF